MGDRRQAGIGGSRRIEAPYQTLFLDPGAYRVAIIDSRLNLRSLVVVIPRRNLKIRQGRFGVILVAFSQRLDPDLPTLLVHDSIHSPGRLRTVEALERATPNQFIQVLPRRLIEAVERGFIRAWLNVGDELVGSRFAP